MNKYCDSQRVNAQDVSREGVPAVTFVQPSHCNWLRYVGLMRTWRRHFRTLGALAACVAVLVLSWRAAEGVPVSVGHWLFAIISGILLTWLSRLAVLVLLSAPRKLTFTKHEIHLSGLGWVRIKRALRWSIRRNVLTEKGGPSCAELRLTCLWCGHEREWRMLVDDEADAARLLRILQERLPQAVGDPRMRQSVIAIESGAWSR